VLRRNPGFTAVSTLSLALGIGANTAIFSLVNTILLRPLPVARPNQLVSINLADKKGEYRSFSYPTYRDLRDRNEVLTGLAVHKFAPMSLSHDGGSERVWGSPVSGNYFELLGVTAARGRTFTADEDRTPNANPVAVLSYACWQRRFGADPDIVGRTIVLNGHSFTVLGVAPENFSGTELVFRPEIWVPSLMQDWIEPGNVGFLERRGAGQWFALGRLGPGVTEAQALASLNALVAELGREFPDYLDGASLSLSPPGLLIPELRGAVIGFSGVVLAAVTLVLLMACANIAGLLLARASSRRKEIAIRLALGATRSRVVRQLLVESVLLSLAGGAIGLLLARWAVGLLVAFELPIDFPLTMDLQIDWRVLAFTALLSLLTGVAFGLIPALQTSRPDLVSALKDGSGGGYRGSRTRSGLIVAQTAISLVLLISAGLVIRSLQRVQLVGPGFATDHALALSLDVDLQGYDEARGRAFQRQLAERVG
jgi:predicted permease